MARSPEAQDGTILDLASHLKMATTDLGDRQKDDLSPWAERWTMTRRC